MSRTPIDHSPDLLRLREAGYNIRISNSNFLLVSDVPYVNSSRRVARGILATNLDLRGDVTVPPQEHTIKFVGDFPCDRTGAPLESMRHASHPCAVGDELVAQQSFSRKPGRGHYNDYFEKITAYAGLLERHAIDIDPEATARTRKVIEPEDENSVFNYLDAASARYEITTATAKLEEEAVGIVGLGGTGSYVLDLICKAPIKKIHLFDGDVFLTHNAFRAPGAPSLEKLREQQFKVNYFHKIYSRMHRGIISQPVYINETNVELLRGLSFVFLCLDEVHAKKLIIAKLEEWGMPFVDVGMGLYSKRDQIGGTLRSVLSLSDRRVEARARISFAKDEEINEYDKNIQVADLNALNACLAVLMWKKLRGFYFNMAKERFQSFTIPNSLFVKDDIFE